MYFTRWEVLARIGGRVRVRLINISFHHKSCYDFTLIGSLQHTIPELVKKVGIVM